MDNRKITIKESIAERIAEIAWHIESKGLPKTALHFSEQVYDFIETMADSRKVYKICREPDRKLLGYKCITYKKKYTLVFLEFNEEI